MTRAKTVATAVLGTIALLAGAGAAGAATCGNGPGGFEAWKQQFGEEAQGQGRRRQPPSPR